MVASIAAVLVLAVFWGVGAQQRLTRLRTELAAAQELLLARWRAALSAMAAALPAGAGSVPAALGDSADQTRAELSRALAAQKVVLHHGQAGAVPVDLMRALDASSTRLLQAWTAVSDDVRDLAGPLVPAPLEGVVAQSLLAVETARTDFNRVAYAYNTAIAQFPARLLASAMGLMPAPLLTAAVRPGPSAAAALPAAAGPSVPAAGGVAASPCDGGPRPTPGP